MAYQPVFVSITDVNGRRQSYSCRKRVTWVDTCINFSTGASIEVNSSYDDKMDGKAPQLHLMRRYDEGGPVVIDISGLVNTDTEIWLGNTVINMRELANDPQAVLAKLVAQYIEDCAQRRVS